MVGYGPEDDHFVVELTYNYTVRDYKMGNDFKVNMHANFPSFLATSNVDECSLAAAKFLSSSR